jgi:hypothetical protein
VSETQDKPKAKFLGLPRARRVRFAELNLGFFSEVARVAGVSRSTVRRTWYGDFRKLNPAIVAALEAEYERIQARDAMRRSRLKLKPRLAETAA